jgi:PAS domain S-box-containing protein
LTLEEALRESEARYRTLFEQAPFGVLVFDRGLRVTACNERCAAMIQSTVDALVGLELESVKDLRPLEAMREALEGRVATWEGQYAPTTGRGSPHVHVRVAPFRNPDGVVVGGIMFIEDVTERKLMEAQLRQNDRMVAVGTLAAGVAHEINNPLAYLRANLDLIASRTMPELLRCIDHCQADHPDLEGAPMRAQIDQLKAMVEVAREGAERVRHIVADLRSFARTDDGIQAMVDVRLVLDACLNIAHAELARRAQVVRDFAEVPLLLGNESRLGQVFLNLILNAAQAIPEDRPDAHEVRVRVRERAGDGIVVTVTDTGRGMSEEELSRVFDPFFTTKPTGTGLGLWVSRGIVATMGGEIHAESSPGHGTTFTVTLPVPTTPTPPPTG